MKLEPLLTRFDELADAPERIPALRKVILAYLLHAAVNSSDAITRAATLREAHEVRRRELFKSASRKAVQIVPDVTDEDLPPSLSDIPPALFDRLGNVTSIEKGLSQIQRTKPGNYPLVVTAEARSSSDSFDFEGAATIIPLVSSTGHGDASLKRLHYQEGRYAVGNILAVVKPICPDSLRARFIYEYLSAFKEELLVSRMVGTANVSLTVNKLKEVPVPMVSGPVLSRIDELMALCDRLEAQQQERETRHAALARAALARFAEAPTPANLQFLFHPSYSISPADLRKSILTLAVQGKLVPQDPNDEPAQAAVAKIEKEREQLIATKQFRRSQLPGPIGEGPFDIPETWVWMHLGNAMLNVTDGFHSTPKIVESGVRYVTAKHVKPGLIDFDSCLYVSEDDFKEIASKTRPRRGDVLVVNIGAGSGLASIIEADFEFAFKNVAILNRSEAVDSKFLFNYLVFKRDDIFEEQTRGGAQPFLSLGLIRQIPFPLPPLAEQRRIVVKVQQLVALVDALEIQLAASRAIAAKLLDAIPLKGFSRYSS